MIEMETTPIKIFIGECAEEGMELEETVRQCKAHYDEDDKDFIERVFLEAVRGLK